MDGLDDGEGQHLAVARPGNHHRQLFRKRRPFFCIKTAAAAKPAERRRGLLEPLPRLDDGVPFTVVGAPPRLEHVRVAEPLAAGDGGSEVGHLGVVGDGDARAGKVPLLLELVLDQPQRRRGRLDVHSGGPRHFLERVRVHVLDLDGQDVHPGGREGGDVGRVGERAERLLRRGRRGAARRLAVAASRRRVEDAEPDAHLDRLLGEHPPELPAAEDADDGGPREADVAVVEGFVVVGGGKEKEREEVELFVVGGRRK